MWSKVGPRNLLAARSRGVQRLPQVLLSRRKLASIPPEQRRPGVLQGNGGFRGQEQHAGGGGDGWRGGNNYRRCGTFVLNREEWGILNIRWPPQLRSVPCVGLNHYFSAPGCISLPVVKQHSASSRISYNNYLYTELLQQLYLRPHLSHTSARRNTIYVLTVLLDLTAVLHYGTRIALNPGFCFHHPRPDRGRTSVMWYPYPGFSFLVFR